MGKNIQSDESIKLMISKAFEKEKIASVIELTEGLCNAAYLVKMISGLEVVLKIASGDTQGLMSYEYNMMDAETESMKLVYEKTKIPVAKVLYYDKSKSLCSGYYFIMEKLEGDSFYSAKESMKQEDIAVVNFETGRLTRSLNEIKGNKFGYMGILESQKESWFETFQYMILGVISDGKRKEISLGMPYEELEEKLMIDQNCFAEVVEPSFVHWDMWDGNIFVKGNKITGVIDWERGMWSEYLMEERFRDHNLNDDFLAGYGIEGFSENEKRRMKWYDIYLYAIMMIEGSYRGYPDNSQYEWAKEKFAKAWSSIG